MHSTLEGNVFGMGDLVIILIAKLVLTAVCVGFGLASGVFTPALVIGLLFGALVGEGLGDGIWNPDILASEFLQCAGL